MNDVLIKADKICKTFRNGRFATDVLFDIDLQVRRGEFVAIMGPSGCGKSTLMHNLGLMLAPTAGDVTIDGHNISQLSPAQKARLRRDSIGFVFQRFNLLGTISAYQNIAVAQRIRKQPSNGQIESALEAVQMSDKAHRKPSQLSIGEQQRIAIARAVAHQPAVVMADEPTGNLDSANAERILELFRCFHRRHGIAIVMVTHSPAAADWADRVIEMADGKIKHA